MNLLTPGDSAPASVDRYLLPHEDRVITVRKHPAVLVVPVAILFGALVLAAVLGHTLAAAAPLFHNVIWWAWLLVLVYFMWKLADWVVEYIVITRQRILLMSGLLTRKVAMMPLTKVTDMSFQRTVSGRMLGYGEFIFESAGQQQALRSIQYIPHPETLYREVCDMIFPEERESREEQITALERQIDDRWKQIDDRWEQIDHLREQIDELRRRPDDRWKQIDHLQRRIDHFRREVDDLQRQIDEIGRQIDDLRGRPEDHGD